MSAEYPFARRRFLATATGTASALVIGPALLGPGQAGAGVRTYTGRPLPTDLFTLGVASGDPLPDGVVLWTRLAPDPLAGGGMPDQSVPVRWQVAEDAGFRRVRAAGTEIAKPSGGHSVHAEVRGLQPDREYFYRFRAGDELSPVGRTRTAPRLDARVSRLRFAFASCHNWQDGFFTAYHHLAEEDLAFVAFLGDYIYETVPRTTTVRTHEGAGEPITLVDYRNRPRPSAPGSAWSASVAAGADARPHPPVRRRRRSALRHGLSEALFEQHWRPPNTTFHASFLCSHSRTAAAATYGTGATPYSDQTHHRPGRGRLRSARARLFAPAAMKSFQTTKGFLWS